MSVPEAAVDKYGNSLARQDNIRRARQFLAIQALAITEGTDKPTYNPLGRRVLRLHSPHDVAALSCGKRIHVFWKFNLTG